MMRNLCALGLALTALLGLMQFAAAQAPCGPEKVCTPVVETKTVAVRVYDDVCVEYCVPHCSFLNLFTGGCADCAAGKCGSVHTKKVLVVKIRKHDECVNKCVVAPTCPGPVIPPGK
jgi:hypothetical protein